MPNVTLKFEIWTTLIATIALITSKPETSQLGKEASIILGVDILLPSEIFSPRNYTFEMISAYITRDPGD